MCCCVSIFVPRIRNVSSHIEEKKANFHCSSNMADSTRAKRRRQNEDSKNTSLSTSPVVVFANGAGAPSSSEWMIRWKELLKNSVDAVEVVTFDYPYLSGGKKRAPPKAEKLIEFHKGIVKETTEKYPGHPLSLAGKSMGSRVSCMIAADVEIAASAIICMGYPLKGTNGKIRDETLLQLDIPVMFVQGNKDTLCPLDKLEIVRKMMKCESELYVIDGGGHSFKIGKKHLQENGLKQDEAEMSAVQALGLFISSRLRGD